jgi:hypothetical protein
MVNEGHQVYCGSCGSIVQAGDRFCGVCGARIPPDAQDATPTEQIPTPVPPPPSIPSRRRNRNIVNGVMVGVLLVLLLAGAGALALTNLGSLAGLLGGAEGDPAPSGTPHASGVGPEEQGPATPSPDSPEATTSDASGQSTEEMEAEAEEAAEEYYRAVGLEDWAYTYNHLDAETKSRFTRREWLLKNQWFADNGEVIYRIESVEKLGTSSGLVVGVSLRLTYEGGSSSTRSTYFVYEDGEWKHAFGQEEYDLFMPEASYEEFVAAQR